MKKIFVVVLIGLALLTGFIMGQWPWEWLRPFKPVVIVPQARIDIDHLAVPNHFAVSQVPPFSSDHYYFRCGFTDVDEYWSFCLPPELAEHFLATYVEREQLPTAEAIGEIPSWVSGQPEQDEWDSRYWFNSISELDQVYYRKFLFCGYSVEQNRIYLMNWNE